MARTAVARSACAVQMMTGTSASSRLISGSASMPLMRGMLRSMRITAGRSRCTCWSAAAPSSAVTTWKPWFWRTAPRSERISASSSTTRILVIGSSRGPELVDRHVADRGHRTCALGQQQQVQLDELVSLALEEALDPGARLELLAQPRHAQVLALALDVDPRAHPHVPIQGAVGLLEVHAGMGRRVGAPVHRQGLATLSRNASMTP